MSIKDLYRVGRRTGQARWQIKQAPGWRVVHHCDDLAAAVAWFKAEGIDPAAVTVLLAGGDWPTLTEAIERGIA